MRLPGYDPERLVDELLERHPPGLGQGGVGRHRQAQAARQRGNIRLLPTKVKKKLIQNQPARFGFLTSPLTHLVTRLRALSSAGRGRRGRSYSAQGWSYSCHPSLSRASALLQTRTQCLQSRLEEFSEFNTFMANFFLEKNHLKIDLQHQFPQNRERKNSFDLKCFRCAL